MTTRRKPQIVLIEPILALPAAGAVYVTPPVECAESFGPVTLRGDYVPGNLAVNGYPRIELWTSDEQAKGFNPLCFLGPAGVPAGGYVSVPVSRASFEPQGLGGSVGSAFSIPNIYVPRGTWLIAKVSELGDILNPGYINLSITPEIPVY